MILGFFLPVESGHLISFFVLQLPLLYLYLKIYLGLITINSTPSSIAFPTSLAEPGIFSLSLLYKHLTEAFCLTAVRTQSIAVSPPPITTTSFSAFSVPSSKVLLYLLNLYDLKQLEIHGWKNII